MGSETLRLNPCRLSWLLVILARLSATWSPPTITKTWGVSLQEKILQRSVQRVYSCKRRFYNVKSSVCTCAREASHMFAHVHERWYTPTPPHPTPPYAIGEVLVPRVYIYIDIDIYVYLHLSIYIYHMNSRSPKKRQISSHGEGICPATHHGALPGHPSRAGWAASPRNRLET